MEYMELKIFMSDKYHRYYNHTKFRQNPRGDPKFLVDLTWNDSQVSYTFNPTNISLCMCLLGYSVDVNLQLYIIVVTEIAQYF